MILTVRLSLKSACIIGSGSTGSGLIDRDIVQDEFGLPYIPARRIRGLFRDAMQSLQDFSSQSGIQLPERRVQKLFGCSGKGETDSVSEGTLTFSNLVLPNYQNLSDWFSYFQTKQVSSVLNQEQVSNIFCVTRSFTALEAGVAKQSSLRQFRVLKPTSTFEGRITVTDSETSWLLALAAVMIRRIGSMRNRGFGEVKVEIFDSDNELTADALQKLVG